MKAVAAATLGAAVTVLIAIVALALTLYSGSSIHSTSQALFNFIPQWLHVPVIVAYSLIYGVLLFAMITATNRECASCSTSRTGESSDSG